ncbi:MAG TPA: beta-glucosidase, partial [Lachnospiraceae bacterium]|nr:beta-glucosidase [Lachnospiraceae bacterium]
MSKWQRFRYQPCLPLGKDGRRVTGSPSHVDLSRKAASEGMVLLKNEGTALPLRKGERVALFGKGSADYVKGGGGSGDVTCAYVRNLCDGMRLKEKEGKVRVFGKLSEFYEQNVRKQLEAGAEPGMTVEPELPEALLQEAREHADTAIITICRFSGEGWDRRTIVNKNDPYRLDPTEQRMFDLSAKIFPDGDFYLTEDEKELVRRVTALFPKVIAVLNVGGMVDSEWFRNDDRIQGALLAWQGGMEGGLAMADVLTGDVNPSGHLTDT